MTIKVEELKDIRIDTLKEIIVNECLSKGLARSAIEDGCDHAEFIFEQHQNISASIISGIAIAEGQHKRAVSFSRN